MRAVTEFASFTLTKGITAHAALTAEGKTAEEIQTSIGATFKLEGDKLKYFMGAIDVAGKNIENLKRVVVISLAEGEVAPPKAVQVEEMHFIPEFYAAIGSKPVPRAEAPHGRGGRGGRGGGRGKSDGPKGSPWGLSPEEKALKNAKKNPTKPS